MSSGALLPFNGGSSRLRLRAEASAPGPETKLIASRARAYCSASQACGGRGVPGVAPTWL